MGSVPKIAIREKLQRMFKVKELNTIIVHGFHAQFGGGKSVGFGVIYDDLSLVKQCVSSIPRNLPRIFCCAGREHNTRLLLPSVYLFYHISFGGWYNTCHPGGGGQYGSKMDDAEVGGFSQVSINFGSIRAYEGPVPCPRFSGFFPFWLGSFFLRGGDGHQRDLSTHQPVLSTFHLAFRVIFFLFALMFVRGAKSKRRF